MKRWSLFLIIGLIGLAGLGYLIVRWNAPSNSADSSNKDQYATNIQRGIGKMPEGNAVPRELLRLRQQHQLRLLTEREEGRKIEELPDGVYGFSMCRVVALRATRGNTFSLEIHKHEGIVYYVGYASDEHIEKYLTHQKHFHILTYPVSREGASSLFEIPIEFVSKCEERSVGEGNLFDLFVTTIPELHT